MRRRRHRPRAPHPQARQPRQQRGHRVRRWEGAGAAAAGRSMSGQTCTHVLLFQPLESLCVVSFSMLATGNQAGR